MIKGLKPSQCLCFLILLIQLNVSAEQISLNLQLRLGPTNTLQPNDIYHLGNEKVPEISCAIRFSSLCFEQIRSELWSLTQQNPQFIQMNRYDLTNALLDFPFSSYQGTVLHLGRERSPVAVLIIHGLYNNSSQFSLELLKFQAMGFNTISVTLPGHGPKSHQHTTVTYLDWIDEVARAYRLAEQLGEKVLIMGQSTGGLLALNQALVSPEKVAGLILIEPALRVPTSLRLTACGGRMFVDQLQDLGSLAYSFLPGLQAIEQPISTHLGCQVGRLADSVKRTAGQPWGGVGQYPTHVDWQMAPYRNMAQKIVWPTLVTYSIHDTVVDTQRLKVFSNYNPAFIQVIEVNKILERFEVDHGLFVQYSLSLDPHMRVKVAVADLNYEYERPLTKLELFVEKELGLERYSQRNHALNELNEDYDRFIAEQVPAIEKTQKILQVLSTQSAPKIAEVADQLSLILLLQAFGDQEALTRLCLVYNPSKHRLCQSIGALINFHSIEESKEEEAFQKNFLSDYAKILRIYRSLKRPPPSLGLTLAEFRDEVARTLENCGTHQTSENLKKLCSQLGVEELSFFKGQFDQMATEFLSRLLDNTVVSELFKEMGEGWAEQLNHNLL